jgi:hypothetical protein
VCRIRTQVGHESQKIRLVWVKRGLYWQKTRFRARGKYVMRLVRLNKYRLFTAHGRRGVYAHQCTHGGGLGLTSLCSELWKR